MYSTISLLHESIGQLKEKKAKLTGVREMNILALLKATTELQYTDEQINRLESDLKNLYSIQNPPAQMGNDNVRTVGQDTDNPSCEAMNKTPR